MKLFIEKTNEHKEIEFAGTVNELLKKLNINSEVVLVAKNNELVTEDDQLSKTDTIKILSVISGG